jgi:hypothetical protein
MPERGTADHVWRVFENDKEYLVKHFKINVDSESEIDPSGGDWNVVCYGELTIDRKTSTAIISKYAPTCKQKL